MLNEAVTVLLFFTGTVAFVPETPDSNRVEALLMNVQGHEQFLAIPLERLRKPDRDCKETEALREPLCKQYHPFCVCHLRDGVDAASITKVIMLTKSGKYTLPDRPPSELNGITVGDIGWLANMRYVKPRAARVDRNTLKGNVGAQVEFGWTKAATCLFEEVHCEKRDGTPYRKIFDVEFDDWIDPVDEDHPVAELVVFQTKISAEPVVRVQFVKDGEPMEQSLELKVDGNSCPVLFFNSMHSGGDPEFLCDQCEGDSALSGHFRSFGRITGDSNGLRIHRQCGDDDYKELPIILPEICADMEVFEFEVTELVKGERRFLPTVITLGDRIICPAAVLSN